MTTKNRYYRRSRIAEKTFRRIIHYFAMDFSASDTARLTAVCIRSINSIYITLRHRLAQECEQHANLAGHVEVDESYFGPKRIRGKRRRGAGGKTVVFGLFKCNGWVYTEIAPNARKPTLQAVIRGKVDLNSVIHSDGWATMVWLILVMRSIFGFNMAAMNLPMSALILMALSPYWAYAKLRLSRSKGIHKQLFYCHLKETEFRFNHHRDSLYHVILKLLREQPI